MGNPHVWGEVGASELIYDYEQGRGRGEIGDGAEYRGAMSYRAADSMSGVRNRGICVWFRS